MKILYTNKEQTTDIDTIVNTGNSIYINKVEIDSASTNPETEKFIKIEDERGILFSFLALNKITTTSYETLTYYIELLKDNVDKIVLICGEKIEVENETVVNNPMLSSIVNELEIDVLLTLDNLMTYQDLAINDTNIVQITDTHAAILDIRRAIINTQIQ